jgi:hypothetical protein
MIRRISRMSKGDLDSIFFSRLRPLADDFAKEENTKMSETCLNQIDLARRWRISPRTLERWRWLGEGPQYLKLGGRVLYRVSDIEAYEQSIVRLGRANTDEPLLNRNQMSAEGTAIPVSGKTLTSAMRQASRPFYGSSSFNKSTT